MEVVSGLRKSRGGRERTQHGKEAPLWEQLGCCQISNEKWICLYLKKEMELSRTVGEGKLSAQSWLPAPPLLGLEGG